MHRNLRKLVQFLAPGAANDWRCKSTLVTNVNRGRLKGKSRSNWGERSWYFCFSIRTEALYIIAQWSHTLTSLINVALLLFFLGKYARPYKVIKDPSFIYFWKKIIEKLGKNGKIGYFQKLIYSITKIPGPSFIRFRYFFQYICNPTFIREIRVEVVWFFSWTKWLA